MSEGELTKVIEKCRASLYFFALRMRVPNMDVEDMVQEGIVGMIRGMKKFDPSLKVKPTTFAVLCAKRQMITVYKTQTKKYYRLNQVKLTEVGADTFENLGRKDWANAFVDPLEYGDFKEDILKFIHGMSKVECNSILLYTQFQNRRTVAELLGEDVKKIDNAISRAQKKIKNYVAS